MYKEILNKLEDIKKIDDVLEMKEEISKSLESIGLLVDDPLILEQFDGLLDDIEEVQDKFTLDETLGFLIDDIQNYINEVYNENENYNINEVKQIAEDVRSAIYSTNVSKNFKEMEYIKLIIPEKLDKQILAMKQMFDDVKTLSQAEQKILLKNLKNNIEKEYNFTLKPFFNKDKIKEVEAFIDDLRELRKSNNILDIKNEFYIADIPQVEFDIEKNFIDKISLTNNIGEAKRIISNLVRELALYYEIKLDEVNEPKPLNKIIVETPKKKRDIEKEDLLYFEDTEDNIEINKLLKVFHSITKPHKGEYIGDKYKSIIKTIQLNMSPEDFQNLKLKYNPKIGLLIESKEGFNNPNQKLLMSHSDLVPTFEKLHTDVVEGRRKSALTLGEDGLIRGSLDNTLPNAVVIYNFLEKKYEDNVSLLFEVDEESGMTGSTKFFKSESKDNWVEVKYLVEENKLRFKALNPNLKLSKEIEDKDSKIKENDKVLFDVFNMIGEDVNESNIEEKIEKNKDNKFVAKYLEIQETLKDEIFDLESKKISDVLLDSKIPTPQDDLFIINTDVTMGYETPYAFETRNFSQASKDGIKESFPKGSIANYGFDDSTSTVPSKYKALSFCINVGTGIKETKEGCYAFSGGCHSENTATSKENLETYTKDFGEVIKSLNKDIKIEMTTYTKPKYQYEEVFNYSSYSSSTYNNMNIDNKRDNVDKAIKYYDEASRWDPNFEDSEYYENEVDKLEIMIDVVTEIIEIICPNIEILHESQMLDLTKDEYKLLSKHLAEYSPENSWKTFKGSDTIEDIANIILDTFDDNDIKKIMLEKSDDYDYTQTKDSEENELDNIN